MHHSFCAGSACQINLHQALVLISALTVFKRYHCNFKHIHIVGLEIEARMHCLGNGAFWAIKRDYPDENENNYNFLQYWFIIFGIGTNCLMIHLLFAD